MVNNPSFTPSTMMTTVTVLFGDCRHAEFTTVVYDPNTRTNLMMKDGPCSAPACQKRFVNKTRSDLQLAGMACEGALRRFNMVEPMLREELMDEGCSDDAMIEALLNCAQRSPATETYLGHRAALSTLAEYELSTDKEAAGDLAIQLIVTLRSIQRKLLAIQAAVFQLSRKSFPAPLLKFSAKESFDTFEQTWGKQQLAALQSTTEGRAILSLPLKGDNILAAKSSVLSVQTELATLHANERAAFCADYPGVEALYACGAMKSLWEMLAERSQLWHANSATDRSVAQSFPGMVINVSDYSDFDSDSGDVEILGCDSGSGSGSESGDSEFSDDIRDFRCERVNSRKMNAHKCLGVDMEKVKAYSGKSYEALTNPWWAAAKVAA